MVNYEMQCIYIKKYIIHKEIFELLFNNNDRLTLKMNISSISSIKIYMNLLDKNNSKLYL